MAKITFEVPLPAPGAQETNTHIIGPDGAFVRVRRFARADGPDLLSVGVTVPDPARAPEVSDPAPPVHRPGMGSPVVALVLGVGLTGGRDPWRTRPPGDRVTWGCGPQCPACRRPAPVVPRVVSWVAPVALALAALLIGALAAFCAPGVVS